MVQQDHADDETVKCGGFAPTVREASDSERPCEGMACENASREFEQGLTEDESRYCSDECKEHTEEMRKGEVRGRESDMGFQGRKHRGDGSYTRKFKKHLRFGGRL